MAERQVTAFNRLNFQESIGNVATQNEYYANVTLPAPLVAQFPEATRFERKIGFAAKAANVPDMVIGRIPVNFRSSKVNLPGDGDNSMTFDLTVRCDIDYIVRDVMEKWSDSIQGKVNHDVIDDFDVDITKLFGQGEVHQLSRNGKIIRSWTMADVWPESVGALTFDWSAENTVMEFPVSFAIQHMESANTRNNVISEAAALSGDVIF